VVIYVSVYLVMREAFPKGPFTMDFGSEYVYQL